MSKAKISEPCAYCGTSTADRHGGHVISRNLYPDSLAHAPRIVVPECSACKALWEDAEPHFRNVILAVWNSDEVPDDNRYDKMMRSLKYQPDGERRVNELFRLFRSVNRPCGPRTTIDPTADPTCNVILRRIVRGLCHYHGLGTAVPDERVFVRLGDFPETLSDGLVRQQLAPDFFGYGFAVPGIDLLHSVWSLRFSTHLNFVGGIATEEGQHSLTDIQ